MFFSIILPVFNSELFIRETIKSVLEQSFSNFELIIIDDGSTDGTLSICESLRQKDSRIKIISVLNGGPSRARNIGISEAIGDYILFVDGDDTLASSCLFAVNKTICEDSYPDIVCFGYKTIRFDYRKTVDLKPNEWCSHTKENVRERMIEIVDSFFFNVVWNKAFKANLIKANNLFFDESLRIGEDKKFCLNCLPFCESWKMLDQSLYNYYVRNANSISSSCDLEKMNQQFVVHESYKEVLSKAKLPTKDFETRVYYDSIKICLSFMMDLIRFKIKGSKEISKEIYFQYYKKDFAYSKKTLSKMQRLTLFFWNTGNFKIVFFYVKMLVLYKYKLKLFKESKNRI